MDEHVLQGNAAIVKCHIPSFISDFVFVSAWILDDNNAKTEVYAEPDFINIEDIGILSLLISLNHLNEMYNGSFSNSSSFVNAFNSKFK